MEDRWRTGDILLMLWTFWGFHADQIFAVITCSEAVLHLETHPLQLIITEEADPHEASTREDKARAGGATEAIDEWREAEGAVPHLDVVETALEGSLNVEVLAKEQFYPLTGQSWEKRSNAAQNSTTQMWDGYGGLLWPTFQNIQAFLVGGVGTRVVWWAEAAAICISLPVTTVKGPQGPRGGFDHFGSGSLIWLDEEKKGRKHRCSSSYGRKTDRRMMATD